MHPLEIVSRAGEQAKRARARGKLEAKGCDWIVANDVSDPSVISGGDNTVTVIDSQGADAWPRASKIAVARRLARRIAEALQ